MKPETSTTKANPERTPKPEPPQRPELSKADPLAAVMRKLQEAMNRNAFMPWPTNRK